MSAIFTPPPPRNEPVLGYAPGSAERASLEAVLLGMAGEVTDIVNVIDGEHLETGRIAEVTMPSEHGHVLGRVHFVEGDVVQQAVDAAAAAQADWAAMPWAERAAIFLKAGELLAGPWRDVLNASTMLGQGKTVHQAEIDAACELIDFLRYNVHFAARLFAEQPESAPGIWNRSDHRPLEGFVLAITPFNFTSIAGNLPTAPALLGNTVVWKPARTQALSAWFFMKLMEEAGLPPGVINLVHGSGADVGDIALADPRLAGVHFTGSTGVFQHLWRTVGENIASYRTYPRLVGETGGKDFIIAHPSADVSALAVAIFRGAFEFQGQKCSAASRVYVPSSIWPQVRDRVVAMMGEAQMGDVRDFRTFIGPVIDRRAFTKHTEYQHIARTTGKVLAGGGADASVGWFIEPTLVQVDDPGHVLLREEIFGPILTAYVYPDAEWSQTLDIVDGTSPYALTGAVFAQDRRAVNEAMQRLRNAAGNFYINDKPTGAVVGQQPFGGARASGTNDKAGSALNLLRWLSPRSIKENLNPPRGWRYPYLG
ncbi:MAG: L-glutamate gamma-semialdehyde dehydrogenase [Alphaproteobacteria bacterium]|nr:L-glutamate gamma-semialdehyde dehydrogenase [Alphaproteobacteria bacterium]MCB9792922.1 L-glutamate gamma-semialdehyde dehydrogenase [Alphaproteobacteria bacterium]